MGNFGKSRLRKGISIVASMVLLLSSIMPTVPVFGYEVQPGNVACVEGGSCYGSLTDAITNASEGGTITLMSNIGLDNYIAIDGINIDLNGYTVTSNGGVFDCYNTVTISDKSGNKGKIIGRWGVWANGNAEITIEGVSIEVKRSNDKESYGVIGSCKSIDIKDTAITSESYGLNIGGSTEVTVMDTTINATYDDDTNCWGAAIFDNVNLEINGETTITSKGYGISTNGNAGENATILINGGNINGAELGIYQPSGTVTINGGQIKGETAIYQKAGDLTIKDATIIANGAANAYSYWGNGGNPTGDGIVVDSCAYPGSTIGDNPNLTILNGVTINSANGKQVGYYEANTDKPGWSMGVISSKNGNLTLPGSFVWIEDGDVFKIGYTVNFNCGEGCDIEDGDVLLGNTITKPDAPDGYTIDKWYKDSEKTDEWIFDDVVHVSDADHVNGVITLYATKATISYTIKYNLDGGTNGTNPENYTIESDDITLASPTKDEYDFDGWYSDENFTKKIVEIKKGSTGNVELWAKWNKIEALPTGEDAITATGENNALITAIVVDNDVPATDNPTDQNDDSKDNDVPAAQVVASGFTGQVKGGISVYGVAGTTTGIENIKFSKPYPLQIKLTDTTLTGVYLKVKHGNEPFGLKGLTTKSDVTCGDDGSVTSGAYNGEIVPVSAGGIVSFYTCSASTFVAYTETANPAPRSSGGGGSSYSCKNLPANAVANNTTKPKKNTDYSYSTDTGAVCTFQCKTGYTWNETDSKCEKADETVADDETNKDETTATEDTENSDTSATEDLQKVLEDGYNVEFHKAYEFAFQNGITTMPTIEEADMNGNLNRIAMAKMLSQYAINILGKTPDTTREVPNFPDVDAQLDADYNNGVTLAYQLGIMGINIDEFRPFDYVTRAEFGTALSRMLFGLADGEELYYSTHLAKLMEEKIITNDNPDLQELRGYVMIMLMRSANK